MERLVVSASRTKDLVRRCPDALAAVLTGERDCRFGLSPRPRRLAPSSITALVLWTKSAANLVDSPPLRAALTSITDSGGLVTLQLTVTGLGGTLVEPGIPTIGQAFAELDRAVAEGILRPEAVTLRVDPLVEVTGPGLPTLGNTSPALLTRLVDEAARRGLGRLVTSSCDTTAYPRVPRRLAPLDLVVTGPAPSRARGAAETLGRLCGERGLSFGVCVSPPGVPDDGRGCVDGAAFNRLRGDDEAPTAPARGQRPRCRCTASRDIGYSKGFRTCFTGGGGCIYCYAQGSSLGAARPAVAAELDRLRHNPGLLNEPPYRDVLVSRDAQASRR